MEAGVVNTPAPHETKGSYGYDQSLPQQFEPQPLPGTTDVTKGEKL